MVFMVIVVIMVLVVFVVFMVFVVCCRRLEGLHTTLSVHVNEKCSESITVIAALNGLPH